MKQGFDIERIADQILNHSDNEWVSKKDYPRPPEEWGSEYHETPLGWGRGRETDGHHPNKIVSNINKAFRSGNTKAVCEFMDYLINEKFGDGVDSYSNLVGSMEKDTKDMMVYMENKLDAKWANRKLGAIIKEIEENPELLEKIKGKKIKDLVEESDSETVVQSLEDLQKEKEYNILKHDNAYELERALMSKINDTSFKKIRKSVNMRKLFQRSLMIRAFNAPDQGLGYPLRKQDNDLRNSVIEGITIASGIIDWRKIGSPVHITSAPTGDNRSHYSNEKGVMELTENAGDGTYLHELGHHIECHNPIVKKMARDFYNRRTKGQKLVKMKVLDPDGDYKDWEYGRDDSFVIKYAGKDYPDGFTEVVSVGIEQLYRDPINFRLKDPDHFQFVIDVLSVVKHDKEK